MYRKAYKFIVATVTFNCSYIGDMMSKKYYILPIESTLFVTERRIKSLENEIKYQKEKFFNCLDIEEEDFILERFTQIRSIFEKLRREFNIEVEKVDMRKTISRAFLMATISMEELEPQRLDGKYGKIPEDEKAILKKYVGETMMIMEDIVRYLK